MNAVIDNIDTCYCQRFHFDYNSEFPCNCSAPCHHETHSEEVDKVAVALAACNQLLSSQSHLALPQHFAMQLDYDLLLNC